MHQNLKFNFMAALERPQPIVAAQVHGTFFGIFMNIHKWDPRSNIHKCSFYLQNFRGPISIGFKDEERNVKVELDNGLRTFVLELNIMPFCNKNGIVEKDVDFEKTFLRGDQLDAQFKICPPPSNLYNENKLDNSAYIDPYKYYRDGECYVPVVFDHENEDCPTDTGKNNVSKEMLKRRPNGICDMTMSDIVI